MDSQPRYVAGLPMRLLDVPAAVQAVCGDAESRIPRVYALVNAHSAKLRRESAEYAAALADTTRVIGLADGASVSGAARLLGYTDVGRSPGPDLIESCCAECARVDLPVFLLGGAEGVAAELAGSLAERHPGLTVAGVATPPFGDWPEETSADLARTVAQSGARILWLGVSAPKQEVWAYRHLEAVGMPVVCVGAAFDFNIGRKQRAPRWMRAAGLEWVHRLVTEPRRMWRRYLVGNTLFVLDVVRFGRRAADFEGQAG